jgi:endonuclease III
LAKQALAPRTLGGALYAHYKSGVTRGKLEKVAAMRVATKRKAPSRAIRLARVAEIFERFAAAMPEPKGELEYINHFTLLVAVVLSAQATDVGVNKATRGLFAIADSPQKMLSLGEANLREKIKTIGLYRTKAKNVIALSKALIDNHGGETPANRQELEALPGVGRKTANVVLNIAFGAETIAVDTHVFRVSNRIPIAKGKNPLEVELGLVKVILPRFMRHAHHWLILHGRYTCKARQPHCAACVVADLCTSADKTI